MNAWRFTLEDRMAFQKVRRQVAELVMHGASVAVLRELRRVHRDACRAAYPSHDDAQVATLRTWMGAVETYLEADDQTARRGAVAAIAELAGAVADILGPFPTPAPVADGTPPRPWWMD